MSEPKLSLNYLVNWNTFMNIETYIKKKKLARQTFYTKNVMWKGSGTKVHKKGENVPSFEQTQVHIVSCKHCKGAFITNLPNGRKLHRNVES